MNGSGGGSSLRGLNRGSNWLRNLALFVVGVVIAECFALCCSWAPMDDGGGGGGGMGVCLLRFATLAKIFEPELNVVERGVNHSE